VLLPELVAFHPNRIQVEPDGLSIDSDLEATEALVTPFDRSGAIVRLKARTSTDAALVTFTLPTGASVPVGSSGRLAGAEEPFIIGYDGEAYVEGLSPKNQVEIELSEGGTCSASFSFSPSPGQQARVRAVVCRSLQYVQGGP
jgi:outer membrane usher protein